MSELPAELLAEFRLTASRALAEVRPLMASLNQGSIATLTRIAHQLKGSSGSYGFGALSKSAGLVEKSLAKELPSRLERLVAELEAIVGDLDPGPAPAAPPTPTAPDPAPAPAPAAPVQRSILFGEDDPLIVALVKDRLEREGYVVEHRVNGNDVLSAADDISATLIILDAKLPGLDGFDILARLRQTERHARTPIMLLTALTGPQDAVRAFELGANDYVRKPFSPAELLARIKNLTHDR
jgi:CheY-like chemotaxis protein/HPt (histidine-containing phosphotransfer) domain-containing protein